jgi:hypothetical protein
MRKVSPSDMLVNLSGRALEELRSSLYNEMHAGSEGAKRQQQLFCGPSVALTFNFAVAVGIIMANKMVCLFSPRYTLLPMLPGLGCK